MSDTEFVEEQDSTPAQAWQRDAAKRALDDLFTVAGQYKDSREFKKLLDFVIRFRAYSPFNAMLVHIQMPGAQFVATTSRWMRDYERRIKPGARPLVILQPMGPVMFVFDVSHTEPATDGAKSLPQDVISPFKVRGFANDALDITVSNCARDGIAVNVLELGSQRGGSIETVSPGQFVSFQIERRPAPKYEMVPRRYYVELNSSFDAATRYAILAHELGHLYCGHLGTPDRRWWPDRRGLDDAVEEFEAESVAYLVCTRLGLETRSAQYLADYVKKNPQTPAISLDRVMVAASLIEQMGRMRLKSRQSTADAQ